MKTLFTGQNCIYLNVTDSTNSYAITLLRDGKLVEGTVVYTFHQQKGRGQRGNTWESEPNKNGAFSYVLYPSFLQVGEQFLLNKMAALAVADLLAEFLSDTDKPAQPTGGMQEIKIKWPNDVYVGAQKIAGILIENTLRESNIQHSVVGIGINVNQLVFTNGLNATSLALLAKKEFVLEQVLEKLSAYLEARYLQLKNNIKGLDAPYLQRLYRLNIWANYSMNGEVTEAKIIGVADNGKLKVELKSGKIAEFDIKEIVFLN